MCRLFCAIDSTAVGAGMKVGNYKTRKARKQDMARRSGAMYSHSNVSLPPVPEYGSAIAAIMMIASKMGRSR